MQRGEKPDRAQAHRRIRMRQGCHNVRPLPLRPADMHHRIVYRVHVRNSATPSRGAWAAYVQSTRERVGMTKAELGRRLGKDRGTVHRWETGQTRPDDPNVVSLFAELFGLDVDEALGRAGFKPHAATIAEPHRDGPLDPDVRIVLRRLADPNVSDAEKATIRATLRYLADLADRQPAPTRRPARKRAS